MTGLWLAKQLDIRDCCANIFTETRLHNNFPDQGVALDKLTVFQTDAAQDYSQSGWTVFTRWLYYEDADHIIITVLLLLFIYTYTCTVFICLYIFVIVYKKNCSFYVCVT